MAVALPSYFWSEDQNIDRRTTEQDEFNRRVDVILEEIIVVLLLFFGDLSRFQTQDFFVSKTSNPAQDFRFRHDFGVIATDYAVLNVGNNGGGSSSVDWPVRTAPVIPTADVDDDTFITLTFTGRGDYLIRVNFDTRIADELSDPTTTLPGPV